MPKWINNNQLGFNAQSFNIHLSTIQYTNKLGSFRPDNKNCVDRGELSPNYLPKENTNEKIVNVCNNNNKINHEPMSKFEDWLILGGIVIAVGLFMRIKDRF